MHKFVDGAPQLLDLLDHRRHELDHGRVAVALVAGEAVADDVAAITCSVMRLRVVLAAVIDDEHAAVDTAHRQLAAACGLLVQLQNAGEVDAHGITFAAFFSAFSARWARRATR